MKLRNLLLIILFIQLSLTCFSQSLPETVTAKKEYSKDSTILILVNERKYENQDWQTCFEIAYFEKHENKRGRLINSKVIFVAQSKGIDFDFSWIDYNKLKVVLPKNTKLFKKEELIELGKEMNGDSRKGIEPKTFYIIYVEK